MRTDSRKVKAMAIKRYVACQIREENKTDLWASPNLQKLVTLEDHLDSHRFDEAAERVKFEVSANEWGGLEWRNGEYIHPIDQAAWLGWRACALAREKEFVG